MNRGNFIELLMNNSPEELADFLEKKGQIKLVNAVTFLDDMEANRNFVKNPNASK